MAKRRAFLRKVQSDDPVLDRALARSEKHAEAVESSAAFLAQRSHTELKKTFHEVASGFSKWQADNKSKSQFDAAYTRSTIDYWRLLADQEQSEQTSNPGGSLNRRRHRDGSFAVGV